MDLIPGKSLCSTYNKKIFTITQDEDIFTGDPFDQSYEPSGESLELVDQACSSLGISPASKIRKVGSDKRASAIDSKINKISHTLRKNLYANLN